MANQDRPVHKGWFEEPLDDRDKMYTAPKELTVGPSVNLWTLYPNAEIPAYNQGLTNTCVANATAAALWYQLKKTELTALAEKTPPNDGCYCRRALRSLEKKGSCSKDSWRFELDRVQSEPDSDTYSAAERCKIDTYWRLDPSRPVDDLTQSQMVDDGEQTLLSVRQCLSEGFPIVFGYNNFSGNPTWTLGDDGIWMMPNLWEDGSLEHNTKPGNYGGHAVLMTGYDDDKKVVICQNSWGADSAQPGAPIFYMPYSWIVDYEATSDFWTLRQSQRSSA